MLWVRAIKELVNFQLENVSTTKTFRILCTNELDEWVRFFDSLLTFNNYYKKKAIGDSFIMFVRCHYATVTFCN